MTQRKVPRELAVRVLTRVLSDHEPLDEALAAITAEHQPADRAWLQEVCSGTLRWKGRLDLAIDSVALKKKPSGWLRKMLLIGAYQLIGQERTSPAAAVSETVDAIRKKEGEAPAKFANALLRKISEHAKSWRELELAAGAPLAEAAAWASLPDWLWKALVEDHGLEWATRYARAGLERPELWVRARDAKAGSALGESAQPGPVPGSFRLREGGRVSEREGFQEGGFFVQDISSQALVHGITEAARERLGAGPLRALDLCAAPGGKSVGLLWSGWEVSAADRDERRLALLRSTVERVGQGIRILKKEQLPALEAQDLVWVDAPCSGTGILRRHPDVRWLRREKELAGLHEVQQQLIREAWEKVRPGGLLAYSVCSVLKDEGPRAIEAAKLSGQSLKTWFLVPQEEPCGDGFWGVLIQKA